MSRSVPPLLARLLLLALGATAAIAGAGRLAADDPPPTTSLPAVLDLVLVVDTSLSMEPFLPSVRRGFGELLVEIQTAAPDMHLRIGAIAYGAKRRMVRDPDRAGLVSVEIDESTEVLSGPSFNFDRVLARLDQRLRVVGGGHERLDDALAQAASEIAWTADAVKAVIVVGNEDAARASHVLGELEARGIQVHALYCGGPEDALVDAWRDLAAIGGGAFGHHDHADARDDRPPAAWRGRGALRWAGGTR